MPAHALVLLIGLAMLPLQASAGLRAQALPPGMETFDAAIDGGPPWPCPNAPSGQLPPGWTSTGTTDWSPTASSASLVGPGSDHTSGQGLFCATNTGWQSSACLPLQARLESPRFLVGGGPAPGVVFWYFMNGPQAGALQLRAFDGSAWSTVWFRQGPQGPGWRVGAASLPSWLAPEGAVCQFRFEASNSGFFGEEGVVALDDIAVSDAFVSAYQVDSPAFGVTVGGALGTAFFPGVATAVVRDACPPLVPAQLDFQVTSDSLAGSTWDLAVSPAPPVPVTDPGGLELPDGQRVNLDLFQPLSWLSTGSSAPGSLPLPSPGIPGWPVQAVDLTLSFAFAAPIAFSVQGVAQSPAAPLGFVLSAPTRVSVQPDPLTVVSSVAGPAADESRVLLSVTEGATCWFAAGGGLPFYGTLFTEIQVTDNGQLLFGSSSNWSSAFASDSTAAQAAPMVAFWTDFDPGDGGSIVISHPGPDLLRVDWLNVFYDDVGLAGSFAIEVDRLTGTVSLLGLQGLLANPATAPEYDQFLGLSAGGTLGATNAGASSFVVGGSGAPAAPTDMLYQFNNASQSGSGLPPALLAGLDALVFTPLPGGAGYSWAGF